MIKMKDDKQDNSGVITLPPLIYLAFLIVSLILHLLLPINPLSNVLLQFGLGLPLIGIGFLVSIWAVKTLRRGGATEKVYEPTAKIVVNGPYRFTRNPIYLSFTSIYLGLAISFNSLWPILLLPLLLLVIQSGVINREERYLERKFGKEYIKYKNNVRR